MTATVIKAGGALSGVTAVIPAAYLTYKARVVADGGFVKNETDCANAFALAAKYGVTSGVAISPDWGIRLSLGEVSDTTTHVEKFYSLFGSNGDMHNPYPDSAIYRTFPYEVKDSQNSIHYPSTHTSDFPSSGNFALTTSLVSMIAVRSPTANTASEGYWLTMVPAAVSGSWYRFSIDNIPNAGSSQMRARVGTSVYKDALGAVKAALSRWKVSGMYCDTAGGIRAIEDGAVANTTTGTTGFFVATNYKVILGDDAGASGGTNLRPVEAWFGEGWSIPDASLTFGLALAARMRAKYGEP